MNGNFTCKLNGLIILILNRAVKCVCTEHKNIYLKLVYCYSNFARFILDSSSIQEILEYTASYSAGAGHGHWRRQTGQRSRGWKRESQLFSVLMALPNPWLICARAYNAILISPKGTSLHPRYISYRHSIRAFLFLFSNWAYFHSFSPRKTKRFCLSGVFIIEENKIKVKLIYCLKFIELKAFSKSFFFSFVCGTRVHSYIFLITPMTACDIISQKSRKAGRATRGLAVRVEWNNKAKRNARQFNSRKANGMANGSPTNTYSSIIQMNSVDYLLISP